MKNFTLPKLPYAYGALVPHIDAKTMQIHYTKHHQGYVDKLNAALASDKKEINTLEELLQNVDAYSVAVRNNAGGDYNHTLFWESLCPNGKKMPAGELIKAIEKKFQSFDLFQEEFSAGAATLFGSGWAWLCKNTDGNLSIQTTPNQDNPLMNRKVGWRPILGLDVWEHAYYLHYQNRRPDYIKAFWHIVNWEVIEARYVKAS